VAVKIDIPIRLEVSAQLLRAESSAVIAARLAEAVKQGLEFMADELAADGHFGDPVVHEPKLYWTGPGVSSLSAADRARTEARLRQAVRQAGHAFTASARQRARGAADPAGVVLDHPVAFRTTPRKFFALLGLRSAERLDFEARYHDQLDQPIAGQVFRVTTHGMMALDELHRELARALDRELRGDAYQYDVALSREDVTRFVPLDLASLAGQLATAYVTPPSNVGGDVRLAPRSQLFVAVIRLPRIERDALVLLGPTTRLTVHLRDIRALITPQPFLAATGVSRDAYLAEWGGDPIDVTIYPFAVRRRTHGQTLQALLAEQAGSDDGLELGGFSLLTHNAVSELPALPLAQFTDAVTRRLPDSKVNGMWEVGWSGAYISARLIRNDFKLAAARHRPEARNLAQQIVGVLSKRDPQHHELRHLIVSAYGESDAAIERNTEAFGFLLDALEDIAPARTWLTRLYDASRLHDCQELLVRLAHGTRYANHPAVRNAAARVAAKHARALQHFYVPGRGVHIHRRWMWLYDEVLGVDNELYLIKSKTSRLKKSSEAKLGRLLVDAARTVIQRMVAGETSTSVPARSPSLSGAGAGARAVTSIAAPVATTAAVAAPRRVQPLKPELTKEEFAQAVLEEVQSHITADDLEEVEVQRSIRLLGVRDDDDRGVTRHRVKFAWVENAAGEGWQTLRKHDGSEAIEESVVTDPDGLEQLLYRWEFQTSAVVAQVELKLVGYAMAIFGAVELGLFELVPHAPGFIAFNVIVYLGKAALFGGEFSIDGLMLEAVKGYAMALGFQLFAPVGRFVGIWAARTIGTKSVVRYLANVAVEKLLSGGIAGAGAGALTRFATDLVEIAMGVRQGFSSWRAYLESMGEGALIGVGIEVGSAVFRALGKADSFRALGAAARRAGWSPVRWWTEIGAIQGQLRQWLVEIAGEVRTLDVDGLINALREKFADLAESIVEGTRQAMLRRTLALSRIELNALSASGLNRLLEALDSGAAEALLRELAKDAAVAGRFLEILGALDERLVAMLANRGQLAALAGSPRMLAVLWSRGRLGLGLLDAFSLDVAAAERFLVEADQIPPGLRGRGLQLFEGPLASVPGLVGRLVQQLGTKLLTTVVPEGSMVTIAGELTISPSALARLSKADLTTLLRVCEHPLDPALAKDLGRFEGNAFRFRFRSSVAARVDPWISTMLREAGYANGAPEHALFRRMSDAQKEEMWDLPKNRGKEEDVRPQAARWALGRQHASVHQFIADFQFYVGELSQQLDRLEVSLNRQVEAAIRDAQAANGGRPLSSAETKNLIRRITQQPPGPNGQGGLGEAIDNLTGKNTAKPAIRRRAIAELAELRADGRVQGMAQTDAAFAEARTQHTGAYAIRETRLPGPINPQELAARVRQHSGTLSFEDVETSAYHAHVHTREILPGERVSGANEVETYLNTARENVRSGTPTEAVRRQDGDWSISFVSQRGMTVVNVTPDGIATIATYMPGKKAP
jgi:hypothetical protein